MPSFSTISHLDLTVSDAERSAAWYVDTLGLRRARRSDLDNRIMIVLVHPATGLVIGLIQHHEQIAERFDERRPGLDHVGFTVSNRNELQQWEARLSELGVDHSPVTDAPAGGGPARVFRPPANLQLELGGARPTAGPAE